MPAVLPSVAGGGIQVNNVNDDDDDDDKAHLTLVALLSICLSNACIVTK